MITILAHVPEQLCLSAQEEMVKEEHISKAAR